MSRLLSCGFIVFCFAMIHQQLIWQYALLCALLLMLSYVSFRKAFVMLSYLFLITGFAFLSGVSLRLLTFTIVITFIWVYIAYNVTNQFRYSYFSVFLLILTFMLQRGQLSIYHFMFFVLVIWVNVVEQKPRREWLRIAIWTIILGVASAIMLTIIIYIRPLVMKVVFYLFYPFIMLTARGISYVEHMNISKEKLERVEKLVKGNRESTKDEITNVMNYTYSSEKLEWFTFIVICIVILLLFYNWKTKKEYLKAHNLAFERLKMTNKKRMYKLPDTGIRRAIVLFESTLMEHQQRRIHETITSWLNRIQFPKANYFSDFYNKERYHEERTSPDTIEKFNEAVRRYHDDQNFDQ
jgi:hypothetical protein